MERQDFECGYWLLASGFWLLASGKTCIDQRYRVIERQDFECGWQQEMTGYWLLATDYWQETL